MFLVKRTKSPPPGNEPPLPPAVHYATSAAPAGNVTGWSKDRTEAKPFTDDEAQAILAFHAGLPNVGTVDVEPAVTAGPKPAAPGPVVIKADEPKEAAGRIGASPVPVAAVETKKGHHRKGGAATEG